MARKEGLPNWADPKEKQFACLIHEDEQDALYLMFNAGADAVRFSFACRCRRGSAGIWRLTPLARRRKICLPQEKKRFWIIQQTYRVEARSSAILLARKQESALGGGSV